MSARARWPPFFGGRFSYTAGYQRRASSFECAHIHAAVMQVAHEVRHVMVEELLIGADGVAGQQRAHAFRREAQHVFGDLLLGLGQAQAILPTR